MLTVISIIVGLFAILILISGWYVLVDICLSEYLYQARERRRLLANKLRYKTGRFPTYKEPYRGPKPLTRRQWRAKANLLRGK